MTVAKARCGTPSGYSAHQYKGEKPCDACAAAKAAYDKRRKLATKEQAASRLRARAQMKAQCALAREYPHRYRELYERYLAVVTIEDEAQA